MPAPIVEWNADEIFVEMNVASQLEEVCMIFLGEWNAAKRFVNAG
jgi:hypothetical protein